MDAPRFDSLARRLAPGFSRRWVFRLAPAGMLTVFPGIRSTAAQGECAPGLIFCRGICADPMTNPIFCGSCDNECVTGACDGGVCVFCEEIGLTSCPGGAGSSYCVDLQTDFGNCGGCANGTYDFFCNSGVCVDGACVSTVDCEPGLTECRGRCVDFLTDESHCGSCFRECYGGESQPGVCIDGHCVQCESLGLTWCNSQSSGSYDPYCADVSSDPLNCGDCDVACESGVCQDGVCAGAQAEPTEETTGESDPNTSRDVATLQRLWSLERLSLELLRHGLNTLPREAFEAVQRGSRTNLGIMRIHDRAHVERLHEAIEAIGGSSQLAESYDFSSLTSAETVLVALEELKRTTVSAHLSAIVSLTAREAADALAAILAEEAMHATFVATLVGVSPFTEEGVQEADENQVDSILVRYQAAP